MVPFDHFRKIFMNNMELRSRTMCGASNTSVSEHKFPLLLTDDELYSRMSQNFEMLAVDAWKWTDFDGPTCLRLLTRWFDILNSGVIDVASYIARTSFESDWRLRTWPANYWEGGSIDSGKIPNALLDFGNRLDGYLYKLDTRELTDELLAETLAFVDIELDNVIHPWVDGCGRLCTTLVMVLAARCEGMPLPIFLPKKEHYVALRSYESAIVYYKWSLAKGRGLNFL